MTYVFMCTGGGLACVLIYLGVLPRWIAPSPTAIFALSKLQVSTPTVFFHAFHFFSPRMYVV
jgi:hypothetical protein